MSCVSEIRKICHMPHFTFTFVTLLHSMGIGKWGITKQLELPLIHFLADKYFKFNKQNSDI